MVKQKNEQMNKIDILYQKWQSLQPLPERKQYLLSQRFTVDYNYNSNHIEGNTKLSYYYCLGKLAERET